MRGDIVCFAKVITGSQDFVKATSKVVNFDILCNRQILSRNWLPNSPKKRTEIERAAVARDQQGADVFGGLPD